jgi:hypothetical protein
MAPTMEGSPGPGRGLTSGEQCNGGRACGAAKLAKSAMPLRGKNLARAWNAGRRQELLAAG